MKSFILERYEYMKQIVAITNSCPLPSIFKADVLENALRELRGLADQELKRDIEAYQAEALGEPERPKQPFTGTVSTDG